LQACVSTVAVAALAFRIGIRHSAIPATPPEDVRTDAWDGTGPVFYRIEVEE